MITFNSISEADAKGLAELDKECFSVPWSEKLFFDEASNDMARYVIAKDDDKLVGYGGYLKVLDEGQITNIAVKPDYRRQKIASSILSELIKKAVDDKLSFLSLEVRQSNEAAISLYAAYGFIKVGERKNYYHSPVENAVLMDLNVL